MAQAPAPQHRRIQFIRYITAIVAIVVLSTACSAQAPPAKPAPDAALQQYLSKHPGLVEELGRLFEKWREIEGPAPRTQSSLLPLLPESTIAYAGLPNYGDVLHQAITIFHQELQESAVLREWWQSPEIAQAAPIAEMVLDKLYQLCLFMGDELVVAGAMEGKDPRLLILADIRKPGLKDFLKQTLGPMTGKPSSPVFIMDPNELATVVPPPSGQKFLVLVRPDFVVISVDLAALRNFSAALDRGARGFASTSFGKRLTHSYEGGVTAVEGVDIQTLLALFPPGTDQAKRTLQVTGFGETKYLVWEHKKVAGEKVSLSELSFTGPRHGVASWLAAPAPIGGLEFVSPKAVAALGLQLKNPTQIFDELRQLALISDPKAFAPLEQKEKEWKVSLKDDLLSRLTGEVTLELDDFTQDSVGGKAILRASDPAHLQQALAALLAAMHYTVEKSEDGGVADYTFQIPAAKRSYEVSYAFADGYWIVASSREKVREAVRDHHSGESLGKSKKFLAGLPPGASPNASAAFYENQVAMSAMSLRQVSPDLAKSLAQFGDQLTPTVAYAYGEPTAIRGASTSSIGAVSYVLIAAAIAIPNLLRARIAANEASAVGTVRTITSAQVTYAATYPDKGFATDLAKLGPHPLGPSAATSTHANLIDATLGNSKCTAGSWCEKSGYRFTIVAECLQRVCKDYAVVATPVTSNTGVRNFCSTSDGVVRHQGATPLTSPVTPSECRSWSPLQ
jgi:hypothetical protein